MEGTFGCLWHNLLRTEATSELDQVVQSLHLLVVSWKRHSVGLTKFVSGKFILAATTTLFTLRLSTVCFVLWGVFLFGFGLVFFK